MAIDPINFARTTQVRLRRGTTAQIAANPPVEAEPFYDATEQRMGIGGGSDGIVEQWKSQFLEHTADAADAVARNLQEKLTEVVSVKDFGAVGDGVTDDTDAIQKAINYALSNSMEVFFPYGNYQVTSTITVTADAVPFVIKGNGGSYLASKITASHGDEMFECTSDSTFHVSNMVFDPGDSPSSVGFNLSNNSVHIFFQSCTFLPGFDYCVNFNAVYATTFIQCVFNGSKEYALFSSAGSVLNLISCTFQDNYGGGVSYIGDCLKIDSCFFENNCIDNNPSGANKSNREIFIGENSVKATIIGGTLNTSNTNDKYPIENKSKGLSIIGMREFSKGTASHWVYNNGVYTNCIIINSEMTVTGTTDYTAVLNPGLAGFSAPNLLLGGLSSSGEVTTNANGTSVRFPTGLQVCLQFGFYSAGSAPYDDIWTFPQEFVNEKIFISASRCSSSNSYRLTAKLDAVKELTNSSVKMTFSENDITYFAIAVGLWK